MSTRFVIIGAGSAGLTAARTLLERGHRHITVLESNSEAGGKCRSSIIDGRAYDLGAVLGTRWDNRDLLRMIQKHALTAHDTRASDFSTGGRDFSFPRSSFRLALEMLKFGWLASFKFRRSIRTGEMRNLNDDLCDTFADVAHRRGLGNAEIRLRAIYTGMGYGVAQTIPMAYAVNFMNVRTLSSVLRYGCFGIREGFQELWIREARTLEREGVRFAYGAHVTGVQRNHVVDISIRDDTGIQCDKLIVACDPRRINLDATEQEVELFAHTQNEDYRVLLCRIDGYPDVDMPTFYYAEGNIDASQDGRVMVLYRKFPETNVYAAYMYGRGRTQAEMEHQLEDDARKFGGKLREHLAYGAWAYFPHFSSEALKRGALDRLAEIQNQRHTIYVGEWADFGRLSRTMANARLNTERLIDGGHEGSRESGHLPAAAILRKTQS